MPRFSKKGKVVSQSLRTKKLCPGCGHDDFKVTESRFSWLFGEKFKCTKCGKTFKQANLVRVHEKSREFHVDQTGTTLKARRTKTKHKRH